jgi:hypothetical protein
MPGILTATAAIITAVTGLVAMLYQNKIFDKNPQKPAETIKSAETIKTSEAMEIAGKWAGQIRESSGTSFRLTVEIYNDCKPDKPCGKISVSHVPCYGDITLKEMKSGDYEFHVDNFDSRSDLEACKVGDGEHFRLLADGKLFYTTSYSDAKGALDKVE